MPELRDIIAVVNLAIALGTIAYARLTRASKEAVELVEKTERHVAELEKATAADLAVRDIKIDKLEDRTSRIEGELRHLPDKGQVHRMELSLTEMRGDMKALTERIVSLAGISERLQQFLLDQAKEH